MISHIYILYSVCELPILFRIPYCCMKIFYHENNKENGIHTNIWLVQIFSPLTRKFIFRYLAFINSARNTHLKGISQRQRCCNTFNVIRKSQLIHYKNCSVRIIIQYEQTKQIAKEVFLLQKCCFSWKQTYLNLKLKPATSEEFILVLIEKVSHCSGQFG